jgi:hypothetical protein
MRSLDRSRFIRHVGYLDEETARRLSEHLVEMFTL